MAKITPAEVTAQPWRYTANQWRYAHGIHIPHIAEISPMQYSHLSKTGKRQYDTKRADEWSASAAGAEAWRQAVLDAYHAGTIDQHTPGITQEARSAIIQERIAQDTQRAEQERTDQIHAIQYHDAAELTKGDTVFHSYTRSWMTVERINKKTITCAHKFGTMKVLPEHLYRQDPRSI